MKNVVVNILKNVVVNILKNVVVNILMMLLCTGCFFGESNMDSNFRPGAKYPMVDSLSPAVGSTEGGTAVTISGSHFDENVVVTVDNEPCESLTYISSTSLLCVVPAHEVGSVDLVVSNPELSTTFPGMISYRYPAPRVSGISPFSGGISGGTSIVVSGSGFRAGAGVMLGDTACTQVVVTSSTSLSCVTPTHVDGAVDVVVTNSDDQSATSVNGFTFVPPFAPAITAISPSVGSINGGTSFEVTGTNFVGGAVVTLGGTPCESVSVASATRITCRVAPHSAGLVDVVVTNADGSGAATAPNVFRYLGPPPSIAAVVPAGGPLAGGTAVLIAGNYFEQGVQVTFGGNPCTTIVVGSLVGSSTSITCNTPAQGAGAKNVVVTNSDGQSVTLNSGFTYYSAPSIGTISPSSGSTSGGTVLTVSGSNFSAPGVSVGGNDCPVLASGSTMVICTTAAHAAGAVSVVVTNSDGQGVTNANGFTFGTVSNPPPVVSGISPSSGYTLGGLSVTITGTGFQVNVAVSLGGQNCVVGGYTDTSLNCTTSSSQTTGPKDVVVTNADTQSVTLSSGFTYEYPFPVIGSINPTTGGISGNQTLTITGTNFRSGCAAKVGGIDCIATFFDNSTTVRCTTPPHTVGAKDVKLTNPVDSNVANEAEKSHTLSGAFVYGPTVTSVSPNSGGVMGDTSVTITGENFSGSSVKFGGQAAVNAVVVNAQTITCLTPSGTAGAADVVVTNSDTGAGTKSGGFTYVASSWSATGTGGAPAARSSHIAVWTGSKMIVWSGSDGVNNLNSGGRYDPVSDSWASTSAFSAPSRRTGATAVWTGSKMIVWGGYACDTNDNTFCMLTSTGGVYDVEANSWVATQPAGAPVVRSYHTAIWTGSKMIVWGGRTDGDTFDLNTGGVYDPEGNGGTGSWIPTSGGTNVPTRRQLHTAIWTGSKMIVWGGSNSNLLQTGGVYDPEGNGGTGSWIPTSEGTNVPIYRQGHTAIWTGSKMIVWGGSDGNTFLRTGGVYDPDGDGGLGSWTATSTGANVPDPRIDHFGLWTGTKMIIWGGHHGGAENSLISGGIYDPIANNGAGSWASTSTQGPTYHPDGTAVWTGREMILWGGNYPTAFNTGDRYLP